MALVSSVDQGMGVCKSNIGCDLGHDTTVTFAKAHWVIVGSNTL